MKSRLPYIRNQGFVCVNRYAFFLFLAGIYVIVQCPIAVWKVGRNGSAHSGYVSSALLFCLYMRCVCKRLGKCVSLEDTPIW